jgi:hypothetical protein
VEPGAPYGDSGSPLLPGAPVPAADGGRGGAAVRLPPQVWAALTAHEPTRRRYLAKVYRRDVSHCWYWLGAISDTGHGKLRAGTRAVGDGPASRVVTAHVYGWHLVYGSVAAHPRTRAPVIAHRCDEYSCQNPAHWAARRRRRQPRRLPGPPRPAGRPARRSPRPGRPRPRHRGRDQRGRRAGSRRRDRDLAHISCRAARHPAAAVLSRQAMRREMAHEDQRPEIRR